MYFLGFSRYCPVSTGNWNHSGRGDIARSPNSQLLTHLEESLLVPGNALVDVGGGVGEALGLAGLAAEDTVEVGADLVGAASLEGVALGTTGLEETGTLGEVSCGVLAVCC